MSAHQEQGSDSGASQRTLAFGRIEMFSANRVSGWAVSHVPGLRPLLSINGRAAQLTEWPLPRPDLTQSLRVGDDVGFEFQVEGVREGDEVELYGLVGKELRLLDRTLAPNPALELSFFGQLQRAKEVAAHPGAVAITCWESSHNPVGRAKVLYDVLGERRPAAVFAYGFDEFGTGVWSPLLDSDMTLLRIPWNTREHYHRLLRREGLAFSTVWMCKNRYPTFELAAQIASTDASLILDLDDNEEQFAQSLGSFRKPYGLPTVGLSRAITQCVTTRTVASVTLQRQFGGTMVRHARSQDPYARKVRTDEDSQPRRVGFIGTVRAHKNILAAAKAVAIANWAQELNVEFHVHGDVTPTQLEEDLVANGAVVGGLVPSGALHSLISEMDCVLTGFPNADDSFDEVTRFQISSKIGDALAAGVPALVPRGPSVADLEGLTGVYLFDVDDFQVQLRAALENTEPIPLDPRFSMQTAFDAFIEAERQAKSASRARVALEPVAHTVPRLLRNTAGSGADDGTLLLIWKQQDAGIYGRRIDQIARAYRRVHPERRVVVVEIVEKIGDLTARAENSYSDARWLLARLEDKLDGGYHDADGVEYCALNRTEHRAFREVFEDFMVRQGMTPGNTSVVLFPIIASYADVSDVLAPFPKVVDVVDNQFGWVGANADAITRYAEQYHQMLGSADVAIFNSESNLAHFRSLGMLARTPQTGHLPNWYAPPVDFSFTAALAPVSSEEIHLIYSGNMNDRVDWGLLNRLAAMPRQPWIHLVGTAERSPQGPLRRLLKEERVIYHGPQDESRTLQLLSRATIAVMPHARDQHSAYMNPMKLSMYRAAGLPVVTTEVPGLLSDPSVLVAADGRQFIKLVARVAEQQAQDRDRVHAETTPLVPEAARRYVSVVDALANRASQASTRSGG